MKTNILSLPALLLIPAPRALAPPAERRASPSRRGATGPRMRKSRRVVGLLGTLAGVPEAGAGTNQIGFMPPAVHVVSTFFDIYPPVSVLAHDLALFWPCNPRGLAELSNNAGIAAARAGEGPEHWAVASASEDGARMPRPPCCSALPIPRTGPRSSST